MSTKGECREQIFREIRKYGTSVIGYYLKYIPTNVKPCHRYLQFIFYALTLIPYKVIYSCTCDIVTEISLSQDYMAERSVLERSK